MVNLPFVSRSVASLTFMESVFLFASIYRCDWIRKKDELLCMVNLPLASRAMAALVWSEKRWPMKLDPHVVGKQATSPESFNPGLFRFAFHSFAL